MNYVVRTNKTEKKTYLARIKEGKPECLGVIYTDFSLFPGIRDISHEEVVDPYTKKSIGVIELYGRGKLISVFQSRKWGRRREVASFGEDGKYWERKKIIPYKKIPAAAFDAQEHNRESGLKHAFSLEKSLLSQVFCFEKDGELSGIVQAKEDSIPAILSGLVLVLAERIQNQEYVFEFLRD